MFRIGIDLDGTKIEGIVLDAHGKGFFRKRIERSGNLAISTS
jgi:predicted NBD/HSP70 family sugar kinase